jgi:hypothetical protein
VVERFDRCWTNDNRHLRLPQEDCCQAPSVPPSLNCEADGGPGIPAILNLMKGSDQPEADQVTFLKVLPSGFSAPPMPTLTISRFPLPAAASACPLQNVIGSAQPRCWPDQAQQDEAGDARR